MTLADDIETLAWFFTEHGVPSECEDVLDAFWRVRNAVSSTVPVYQLVKPAEPPQQATGKEEP